MLKIVAAALKANPLMNCSLDPEKDEIIYKNYAHIGVAIDTERGLVVPVIRDVDKKSIIDLSVELTNLGARARQNELSLDDSQGGTFTITNLGGGLVPSFSLLLSITLRWRYLELEEVDKCQRSRLMVLGLPVLRFPYHLDMITELLMALMVLDSCNG